MGWYLVGGIQMTQDRTTNKQSALVWVIMGVGICALLYFAVVPLLLSSL